MVFLKATLVSLDLILGNKSGKQSTCVKTVQAKVFLLVFPQQSVKDEAIFEVSLQYF